MGLPTSEANTESIVSYALEVAGRLLGIASTDLVLPDPAKQQAFIDTAASIETPTLILHTLYTTHQLNKLTSFRKQMGQGRGIDYVFGRHVQMVSESIRTGPALGSREHSEYLKVFKDGNTKSFTDPTIRDDKELCEELARRIALVNDLPSKATLLAANAKLQAVIDPASISLVDMEKQQSKDFAKEVEARQNVIDALWLGKKAIELAVGRDKGLVSFIFFDFRKATREDKDSAEGQGKGSAEGSGGASPS